MSKLRGGRRYTSRTGGIMGTVAIKQEYSLGDGFVDVSFTRIYFG